MGSACFCHLRHMAALCPRSFSHSVSTWRRPGVFAVSLQHDGPGLMDGAAVSAAPSINSDGKNSPRCSLCQSCQFLSIFPLTLSFCPPKVAFPSVGAAAAACDSSVIGSCWQIWLRNSERLKGECWPPRLLGVPCGWAWPPASHPWSSLGLN